MVFSAYRRCMSLSRRKRSLLRGLEYLSKSAENKTFNELPRKMQRDLEETQLTLFIIRPDTPADVKFTIFLSHQHRRSGSDRARNTARVISRRCDKAAENPS